MARLNRTLLPLACLATILHAAPAEAQLDVTVSGSQPAAPDIVRPDQIVGYFNLQITNSQLTSVSLRSVTFTNSTLGPGTQAERDVELGVLHLYRDSNGSGRLEPGTDQHLRQAGASGGRIQFGSINVSIGGFNGSVLLFVAGQVPLWARDSDVLDLRIQAASDFTFQPATTPVGAFPLDPAGGFTVDGVVAAQVDVNPVPAETILAGTRNALVFEIVLPANGYEADQLQDLTLINEGTAVAGSDITSFLVWADDGDGKFDARADSLLGSLVFTGSRWQLSGLAEPVPTKGLRLFFTVDIDDLAADGRTIQFGLPTSPTFGVGMMSGNDGPIDFPVPNPDFQTISDADRVTFTTGPLGAVTVRPGQTDAPVLHLFAKNTYATDKTLSALTLTNTTSGSGTQSELDGEMSQLTLYEDNGDGIFDPGIDPLLQTAFFADGHATFAGFAWTLGPDQTRELFATVNVATVGAKDLDVLSALVADQLAFDFGEPTRAVAVWPLDSGARLTVDGMTAAQVYNVGAPVATVGPNDGPVLALDVIVPQNGYSPDLLDSLVVENRGDAVLSDIAELRLWRDGGDEFFSAGSGDDVDLGPLTLQGGLWRSGLLADPLAGGGSRLFVSLTVSASPRDSATVRLAIPAGGLVVRSDNDGPLDGGIENPETITISNNPLLVTLQITAPISTVGQPVDVLMVVRNAGGESINGIAPSSLGAFGSGALTLTGGPSPASFDLAPAESDTFRWTYTAASPGDVTLVGYAQGTGSPSGTVWRSLDATSNAHEVFQAATSIDYTAANSMPATIDRGQTDVVPLTLTFTNSGGAQAAPVRVLALKIRVEDGSGLGIVPSDLLTAVAVSEGPTELLRKTALENTGAEVQLTLTTPAIVEAAQSVTLSLRLDISPSATAPNFRVAILDSTWFAAEDAFGGTPVVALLQGAVYPVRSGLGRLVSDATRLDVASVPLAPARVGRGQAGVALLTLRVQNPGQTGITADVDVSSFTVGLTDTNGVVLPQISDYLGRFQVRTAIQTLADRLVYPTDGSTLTLVLSPPLTVPVNSPLDLFVVGDVAAGAQLGAFRTQLGDSATFDVTDAGSGAPVPAVYAASPITGPSITVEAAADTLAARGTPRFPPQVTVGKPDVAAMRVVLRHPDPPGTARIRVDSLYIQCRDELRQPLTPASYLDELRVLWNGTLIATRPDPPSTGGTVGVALPGPMLEPGDTAVVDLAVDFSAAAPAGYFELAVFASGIRTADANLNAAVTVAPDGGAEFPLTSGLTRLVPPARELVVDLENRMPATLAADGDTVTVAVLTLENTTGASADSIFLDHLVLRAGDRDFGALPVGTAASGAIAAVSGLPWAQSAALTPDSAQATLLAGSTLGVPPGGSVAVEIRMVFRPGGSPPSSFRARLDAADVGVVQPPSALLQIQVQPAPGSAFPMWTEAGSFGGLTLGESYSNFPNPFAGGRQSTTFAYYLREAARVTLRIVAPNGEGVATLLRNAARPAGMNQADLWDGRNGTGRVVRNGAYIAELTVVFDGGSRDRVLRKVAVVR